MRQGRWSASMQPREARTPFSIKGNLPYNFWGFLPRPCLTYPLFLNDLLIYSVLIGILAPRVCMHADLVIRPPNNTSEQLQQQLLASPPNL